MAASPQRKFIALRAHGVNWRVAPDFADVLMTMDIEKVRHPDRLSEQELIKDNKMRTVVRLPHPVRPEGPALYVKRYKMRGIGLKLKHLILPTQAVRECRASQALISHGIPTCKVVAFAERRRMLLPSEEFLISVEIPKTVTMRQFALDGGWRAANRAFRQELLEEMAGIVVRMVRSRIAHGDLHVGNILLNKDEQVGRRLSIVDLHRVHLNCSSRHGLVRMFRFLAASSRKYGVESPDRVRFIHLVLEELKAPAELTEDELRRWVARVRASWRKQDRRYKRHQTRICLVECNQFAHDSTPDFKVWRHKDFPLDAALSAVRCHQETVEGRGKGQLRKRGNRAQVTLCSARPGQLVCVKAYLRPKTKSRIKDLLRRRSRARMAWIAHRGLFVRGVPAAQGLALLESTHKLSGQPDYLVAEALPVEGRLDQVAPGLPPAGAARRELAKVVADLFRRLADSKVRHPDTKATNILVGRNGARFNAWFTDLDRLKFEKPWPRARWIRHLAHCNARIPTGATLLDRMRCLREIGRGRWTAGERTHLARDIQMDTPNHDPVW